MLEFNVQNQMLSRIDTFVPAEKSVNYLEAKFNFLSDEWKTDSRKKVRVRNRDDVKIYEDDIINGMCLVPWEVLDKGGAFFVSVFCRDGETEITTNRVLVYLRYSLPGGSDTNPPTPTELDLLRREVDQLREEVGKIEVGVASFETNETLTLKDGVLSVNTADVVEENNTLPVTSAAVRTVVGNIGAILDTI